MNLLAILLLPLLVAIGVGLFGEKARNLRDGFTVLGGVVLAGLVAMKVAPVLAGVRPELVLWDMLPGLAIAFRLEPLGLLFACVAAGLWPITSLYAFGYMRAHHEHNQTRFFICFAIAISAAMGIALAANLITLFLFYEVLTLSTVPLVMHHGNENAKAGGRTYLGVLLFTSIGLLLPAIVWTYHLAGTTDFAAGGILTGLASPQTLGVLYGLFLFGVGKAALMPFHRWLPAAMVAPTPVSALLHAVAVVKAGVFCVLKITVLIFGLDTLAVAGAGQVMMVIAAFTILAASIVAMAQDNLKRRLAYSTISQLAYIVLGATLASSVAATGAGLHIVMHALGKITLFFCAGAIYVTHHKTNVSDLDGLGRKMPWTFAAFGLASLSIIGLPPFGGMWSKWWLSLGALDAGQAWVVAVLAVSSLLNIAYLLPIVVRGFLRPAPADDQGDKHQHGEANLAMVAPLTLTALACVAAFVLAGPIVALLQEAIK